MNKCPSHVAIRDGTTPVSSLPAAVRDSVLLPCSNTCFDYVGTMTRIFASLGAKVLAVEPNPDCVRHIELTSSRDVVEVLHAAGFCAPDFCSVR